LPFYETDALDPKTGELIVDKSVAFNKMGHNMHELDPIFEQFSFGRVVRKMLFDCMGFVDPKIVQSMYIFKVS
jgi:phytanoyl-CoA hydroxylase